MARKISAGSAGGAGVAGLQAFTTTLTSAPNLDIIVDPIGTGNFLINGNAQLQSQGDLRFADADSSNYVALQAPSVVPANYTWTLPSADGANNQTLTTNGTGTLAWSAKTIDVENNTTDSTQYNLALTSASAGEIGVITTTNTKLQFQPSTGDLTVNGTAKSLLTENIQVGSYTAALSDRNRVVAMNNAGAATVTIPPVASVNFPIGSVINIARIGAGSVTLVAGAGVTLSKTGTFAPNEEITVRKRASNNWIVIDFESLSTATGGTVTTPTGFRRHAFTSGSTNFVVS